VVLFLCLADYPCLTCSSCTGCPIKPDDEPVKFKQVPLPTISVDWDPKLVREFLSIEKAEARP